MASKLSSSTLLGITCIYFFNQAYGQSAASCGEQQITRCYSNFTRTLLRGALMFDPRTTAGFHQDRVDEVCSAMKPVSPCKHPFMNCPMGANQLASKEQAYRDQRDLFCKTEKSNAYENASRCIGNQPGFQNCTNELSDAPPEERSLASFECAVAKLLLKCVERFSSMCSRPGTDALLSFIASTQALVGCNVSSDGTPDHKSVSSAFDMNTRGINHNLVVSSTGPIALSHSARSAWVVVYAVVVAASAVLRH